MSSWRKPIEAFYVCWRDECTHPTHPCDLDDCEHCIDMWDDLIEAAEAEARSHYREQGRTVEAYVGTEDIAPPEPGSHTYLANVLITAL